MIELECDHCGYKSFECSDFVSGTYVSSSSTETICVDCAEDLKKRGGRTYNEKTKEIGL